MMSLFLEMLLALGYIVVDARFHLNTIHLDLVNDLLLKASIGTVDVLLYFVEGPCAFSISFVQLLCVLSGQLHVSLFAFLQLRCFFSPNNLCFVLKLLHAIEIVRFALGFFFFSV